MCPPATSPSHDIERIWFYIMSKVEKDASFGYWRTEGEACKIFSNSSITAWKNTLEFFEGQAPHGYKTNWKMLKYWITWNVLSKDNNVKECLLCNVFFVDEQKSYLGMPQKMARADMASQSTQSYVRRFENCTGQSSANKPQTSEDNETGNRESVPAILVDIVPDIDYLSGGDFLELADLQIPPSPSSSSDSSCVSMSSGECFDALDLLADIESEKPLDLVQNNAGSKLSVFVSSTPTKMVMHPAWTGTCKLQSEELNDKSMTGSAISRKIPDEKVLKNPIENQKPELKIEGTSSTCRNRHESLGGNKAEEEEEEEEEDKREAHGRKKKLRKKYLCFMPF
ncbi:NAC domain-containing protein 6-like isoform X2 [Humulus lupulus]|uniref:NAC domain-containing protein 6-like isoform X2 n=1 Tax=Humulus lupulus TaxID=3486 RepID=UPI002B4077F9|nr:NAC domain-containing protein 6-like isoform X2 [Humulus lupulus]